MPRFARPAADHYLTILLEPYAGHPIIGGHVTAWLMGDTEEGSLFGRLFNDCFPMLSSGEQATLHWALALWNGNREARVADLFQMDDAHRRRALDAMAARVEVML